MCKLVKIYIDYLYNELGEDMANKLLSIPPGIKILRNDVENLFNHPHIKLWHRFLLKYFDPRLCERRYALIMPCSSVKPYRASATHRIAESVLRKNGVYEYVQVYILSEPMILVPRELDIYYPFANYDYPVHELTSTYRQLFVDLLSQVLPKLSYHREIVAVVPRHHESILRESLIKTSAKLDIIFINYGKKAFHSVKLAAEIIARYVKEYL